MDKTEHLKLVLILNYQTEKYLLVFSNRKIHLQKMFGKDHPKQISFHNCLIKPIEFHANVTNYIKLYLFSCNCHDTGKE